MENIVISRKLKFQVKDQRWNGFLHATCIYSYWEGIITIVIVSITTTYLTIDNLMSVDKDDIVGKQGNSFKTWSTHEVPIINHTHRHWHDQHTTGLNDGYQYQLMIIFYIPKTSLPSTQFYFTILQAITAETNFVTGLCHLEMVYIFSRVFYIMILGLLARRKCLD